MKKTIYLAPETIVMEIEISHMICDSVTGVNGDTDIEKGEGDAPPVADARRRNDWDNDWDDEDDW